MIKNKEQRKTSENFVCFVELKLGQCDGEGPSGEGAAGRSLVCVLDSREQPHPLRRECPKVRGPTREICWNT